MNPGTTQIRRLIDELSDFRTQYNQLIERIFEQADWNVDFAARDYKRLLQQWEDDNVDAQDRAVVRHLGNTVSMLDSLMSRIEEALAARSSRSAGDLEVFRALKRMPFAIHYRGYVRSSPARTADGIDTLMTFLEGIDSTPGVDEASGGKLRAPVIEPAEQENVSPAPNDVSTADEHNPKPSRAHRGIANSAAVRRFNSFMESSSFWTIARFCRDAQITERTLRRFRNGERVDRPTIERIAQAMKMTVEDLLRPDS